MDVRQYTTLRDRHPAQQFVHLLIVADGELQMTRSDPPFLVISCSVTCKLQDLCSQYLVLRDVFDYVFHRSKTHVFEDFLLQWHDDLHRLEPSKMTVTLQAKVDKLRMLVPTLKFVRGEHLSTDHWLDLFRMLDLPRGTILERLTFKDILNVADTVVSRTAELKELNGRAQGEVSIREALRELEIWGASIVFSMSGHQDSQGQQLSLIRDWQNLLGQLGDQQSLLQSLQDSPYFSGFADKSSLWENRLAELDICLHSLNDVQRRWLYLEPIFCRGALSREQGRFQRVDNGFRSILVDVVRDPRLLMLLSRAGVRHTLQSLLDQLQLCQKALNEYLEEKRMAFARFYFLGDEDLLEILGQSTKPAIIQAHLKKLFSGIHSVEFDSSCQYIVLVKSLQGEKVPLRNKVLVTDQVEVWLSDLSAEVQSTLRQLLIDCLHTRSDNLGLSLFPSQILCLAEEIRFTEQVEHALPAGMLSRLQEQLQSKLETYTASRTYSANDIDGALGLKLKALVLDLLHHLSLLKELLQSGARSTDHWCWQRNLRFYKRPDGTCIVRMVDAEFVHSYEYQGNSPKLVRTPLTDRCFLTLTQAMRMGLGGNPYGPAGTGKTESVKALGALLGRQVLVFNCDEGIDVESMGRIFVGLVRCGAWGCFDEFNRLEESVLSAVSMHIQAIQDALQQHASTVHIQGNEVELNSNSGIFITLNPAGKGYGGRQRLPDNLQQLFRPVAMVHSDNELIATVLLQAEGFREARDLGRKLLAFFTLASELLSPQQHYDWGLRALKSVLQGCGDLLRRDKLQNNQQGVNEVSLAVRALRLGTQSKLTFVDIPRFEALIADIFPAMKPATKSDAGLREAFQEACRLSHLIPLETQLCKAEELQEQLRRRTGVVLLGHPGAGKTTVWRLLRTALGMLEGVPALRVHIFNPKAVTRRQLLGHVDPDTREWTDGVLSACARQVVGELPDVHSWIVCDGDIDPDWIEALNSVLDDNRLLTLPSGERIQFGPNVNFIFETHDLGAASPATVSRMGMVFMSDEDLDAKALVSSWIHRQPDDLQPILSSMLNDHFYRAVDFLLKQNEFAIPTSLAGTIYNGLSLLHNTHRPRACLVALIRGLGGNLTAPAQQKLAAQLFTWFREPAPDSRHLVDVRYDPECDSLLAYPGPIKETSGSVEQVQVPSMLDPVSPPVVLTAMAQRCLDLILPWLENPLHPAFLVVGPEGCGKSTLLHHAFSQLRSAQVAELSCTSETGPNHVLHKLEQACRSSNGNSGRVLRPRHAERLLLFLRGISLPHPDKWGTCRLIAFLRQLLTYRGFYDDNLEWVRLENVQLVASMTHVGSPGCHPLSPRFTSLLHICCMDYPDQEELLAMCMSFLRPVLMASVPSHPGRSSLTQVQSLASSMVQLYEHVQKKCSSEEFSHYVFTPRELTHWIFGLLRYNLSEGTVGDSRSNLLAQAWAYEACRVFRDRLVGPVAQEAFDTALSLAIGAVWGSEAQQTLTDNLFVTWSTRLTSCGVVPQHGKPLSQLSSTDVRIAVQKALLQFCREHWEAHLLLVPETLDLISRLDRVLGLPGGSLILAGRCGIGRRTCAALAAHMQGAYLTSPRLGRGYSLKNFSNDLKQVMQQAGIEGQQSVLILEDFQLLQPDFLEMINGILSSGEVLGLYTAEELDPLISPLREQAARDGFSGPLTSYFATRVQWNLHVVIVMDYEHPEFAVRLDSNPALRKCCSILWLESWSQHSMSQIPGMILKMNEENEWDEKGRSIMGKNLPGGADFQKTFLQIHESCQSGGSGKPPPPRRFLQFLRTFCKILTDKRKQLFQRQAHLKAGLQKLMEARSLVDTLKSRAAEQSELLAKKQGEADSALQGITMAMQNVSVQKDEMVQLKQRMAEEAELITRRKHAIEQELTDVQPLVEAARRAVGSIKPESLSEIRSLRMPPDVIRDILEGVLRLMGIFDTSWVSMKSFLAKRGVREDITTFDARSIPPGIRASVEELLKTHRYSFDPKNARRASTAAAPLAAWVQAIVQHSHVLERIQPLEQEQARLLHNLQQTEGKKTGLEGELNSVDQKVAELKERFQTRTTEAASLELDLRRAQETISAAGSLVGQLDGEFQRWSTQISEMELEIELLPRQAQLAAAFITYLASQPEDERRRCLDLWLQYTGLPGFELQRFLSSESEQLAWKNEGLPSDDLSVDNAVVILQKGIFPFLVDPPSHATNWLRAYLQDSRLEVVSQQDVGFAMAVELAVRFGKTLLVLEVENLDPLLIPLLRRDLHAQGPHYTVRLGDKFVDYHEDFRLFLATRNPSPKLSPTEASLVTAVNFTTTRSGLCNQLLALALLHERPEIEKRRTDLLQQEETNKVKLASLEETLLQ
uniref:cytoplasmic dynein 2 heavy chain 1-like n=1 Tax=Myxine glutinosa TaxID=7769 RepID=UPI00358EC9AE